MQWVFWGLVIAAVIVSNGLIHLGDCIKYYFKHKVYIQDYEIEIKTVKPKEKNDDSQD